MSAPKQTSLKTKMKLPSLSEIHLAEWPENPFQQWKELIEQVRSEGTGTQSTRFYERVDEIKAWIKGGSSAAEFIGFLEDRLTLRAMTWLWLNDEFIRSHLLRTDVIKYLKQRIGWLGRLITIQLMSLYLKFYEQLESLGKHTAGLLQALKDLLKKQLEYFSLRRKKQNQTAVKNLFDAFVEHQDMLLSDNAALKTVEYAAKENLDLQDLFDQLGLKGFDTGRFAEQCRYLFYIKKIESLAEGQWDSVLVEIQRSAVFNAPYDGQKLLGHVAMQLLIDKVTASPTDEWLEVLLEIAGDPRISNTVGNFRKWWQPLGEQRISRVRSWLAKEDLRLFLEAVEVYGVSSKDEALQRMFPARKRFLEGLFEQGIIRNARLMLGNSAATFVNNNISKENKINYIPLSDMTDTAVIYLDCGDFHLIQGSHSFKIWLYLAKPTDLFDSYNSKFKLTYSDLIHKIPANYKQKYPGLPYKDITHYENTWRNNVVDFLYGNGIRIDLEKIMNREDYKYYISRFGQPYFREKKYK